MCELLDAGDFITTSNYPLSKSISSVTNSKAVIIFVIGGFLIVIIKMIYDFLNASA